MTHDKRVSAGELARQQAEPFSINRVRGAWQGLLTANLPPAAPHPRYELPGTV
jgi:hypothetical protein